MSRRVALRGISLDHRVAGLAPGAAVALRNLPRPDAYIDVAQSTLADIFDVVLCCDRHVCDGGSFDLASLAANVNASAALDKKIHLHESHVRVWRSDVAGLDGFENCLEA